jgi:hypothetical protein
MIAVVDVDVVVKSWFEAGCGSKSCRLWDVASIRAAGKSWLHVTLDCKLRKDVTNSSITLSERFNSEVSAVMRSFSSVTKL